jgi:hypothetical protein
MARTVVRADGHGSAPACPVTEQGQGQAIEHHGTKAKPKQEERGWEMRLSALCNTPGVVHH